MFCLFLLQSIKQRPLLSILFFFAGVGSLANGVPQSNVLPATPFYDEGGLTRSESPGAGAITMYHNYSFHVASQSLQAGDELLVNYGQKWFEERSSELVNIAAPAHVDPELLRSTGYCVDNIMAGRSKVAHAGRGAFASRHLANRTIVAPVPVLVLPKEALQIVRQRQDSTVFVGYQLLLNYCYGHPSSSRLLCPYGPMVNLINHGAGKYANVKLQWAQPPSSSDQFADTMLLELVAIRPIQKGQELLLDYGSDWVNAWTNHVKHWEPGSAMYVPSYVQNDVVKTLRTEQELKLHPYPENVFTSCYYRYSNQTKVNHNNNNDDDNSVTTVQWKFTRGLLEPRHLRPCRILKRHEGDRLYTVQIRNRYGLPDSQRTPQVHIVTHVPRPFIVFSDKLYTTDPHLETAFRQSIGLSDFPDSWMDVKVEDDGDDTRATE